MEVFVLGAATTKFGELWDRSPRSLVKEAVAGALADANIDKSTIEALFVGNMLSGILGGQEQLGALFAEALGLAVPAVKLEGACASGGLAVHQGVVSILSEKYQVVLVVGIEKMTDHAPAQVTQALTAAGSDEERSSGITFPGLYALMARIHMRRYGTTQEDMAHVAVKNHFHASLNGKAHFRNIITVKEVLKSPKIADPLKLFDCSPISDGASAVILSASSKFSSSTMLGARVQSSKLVKVIASCVTTDSIGLAQREDLTSLKASKMAAEQAFKQASLAPRDIDVAEVHDCFTIAEIMAMEDMGFYECSEAAGHIVRGETKLGGQGPIVNTSGGLKACGHPVGATGVKQIVEISKQLQGRAGKAQVEGARIGLTHNVAGSGGTAVVHILKSSM